MQVDLKPKLLRGRGNIRSIRARVGGGLVRNPIWLLERHGSGHTRGRVPVAAFHVAA